MCERKKLIKTLAISNLIWYYIYVEREGVYMTTLDKIMTMELRESKGKIQQTDSRKLKATLHELLTEMLTEYGFEVYEIQNGLVVEIPNEELGAIPIEIKAIVKNLNFDTDTHVTEYQEKLKRAKEKQAERQRLKELDIASKQEG